MNRIIKFNIDLLVEYKLGIFNLLDKLDVLLDLMGFKAVSNYTSCEIFEDANKLSSNSKFTKNLLSPWTLMEEGHGELNVPILFLYKNKIYSGYFYESVEDLALNTVSYVLNSPDDEEDVDTEELLEEPTHWMYQSWIRMPT